MEMFDLFNNKKEGFFKSLLPTQKLIQEMIFEMDRKQKKAEARKVHEMRPRHIQMAKPNYETVRNGREMEVV